MAILLVGLVLFLGAHAPPILAAGWRAEGIARFGLNRWKLGVTLVSLAGFALIVWGFSRAQQDPTILYAPPAALRSVTALLTVPAFLLLAAAYVPANGLKAAVGHPMSLSVAVWALAHLLSNGNLADLALFGGFLVWSTASFVNSRRKDRRAGTRYPAGTLRGNAILLIVGLAAWAVFAVFVHAWLTGFDPMAG